MFTGTLFLVRDKGDVLATLVLPSGRMFSAYDLSAYNIVGKTVPMGTNQTMKFNNPQEAIKHFEEMGFTLEPENLG